MDTVTLARPLRRDPLLDAARSGSYLGEDVFQLIEGGKLGLGLVCSDATAKSLAAAGAQVHRGDLKDLESLLTGAAAAAPSVVSPLSVRGSV
jgi:hypothetical protein